MISDLSRWAYMGYLYLVGLIQKTNEPPHVPEELGDVISKLTAAQISARQRLDEITTEAGALLKTLTDKELEQVSRWKKYISEFLKEEGVDSVCIDEFLKNPTVENFESLRSKYPIKK